MEVLIEIGAFDQERLCHLSIEYGPVVSCTSPSTWHVHLVALGSGGLAQLSSSPGTVVGEMN